MPDSPIYGVLVAPDAPSAPSPPLPTPVRVLLPQIVPALLIGVGASLLLLGVSEIAELFKDVLWEALPDTLGIGGFSSLWMITILTATGVAVGLVVWKAPGHAGPDPATMGLGDEAPVSPVVVPGLLVAAALGLAGGVSLGPENPIIAANIALAYWLGSRAQPVAPAALWVSLASAATIGALFGTPVAAALVISEALARRPGDRSLWDRLFAPLVAAGAGATTTALIAHPTFDISLPPVTYPGWADLLASLVIAPAAALFGLVAVYAFPFVHAAFRRLPHPMVMLPLGGLTLGLLGALGGHLTLFKGLDEVKEIAADPDGRGAGAVAALAAVKLAALLVAASCGFRGGRIFPAVFIGAAFGLCAHALVPAVHPAVGVASGVLGLLLAITRQGWISLFTAAVLVASPAVLALLCIASLPAWLIVTGRPQMQLDTSGAPLR
ncbi:ion channel protein [Streptomyces purpureus]|uniref:ion channel protein n=1 Tax=Streptomyces purpureus TaxID=1951 RepID=UPI00167160FC|nr:ion channel protein [Streptomyces purpureus]